MMLHAGEWIIGRALWVAATLTLLNMFACSGDAPPIVSPALPELPVINLEPLTDTVRDQFAVIQDALQKQPTAGISNKKFAQLLHAYSLLEPAAVMYRRCELLRPLDLDCWYLHALVLRELGDDAAAIKNLQLVLDRKNNFPRAAIVLADSHRRVGDTELAVPLFAAALKEDANLLEARYGLALAFVNQGDMTKAQSHLEKIHAGTARFGAVHTALASVYRQLRIDTEVAYHTAAAKRFAEEKIPYTDPLLWDVQQLEIGADRHIRDADRMFREGRLVEAAQLYLQALQINPQNDSSHANLVGIYGQLQQLSKAREHYAKALALNTRNVLPHVNLGTVLMKAGDFENARLAFAKVLELQPHHAEARTLHAYCAELQKQQPVDVDEYRLALRDDPALPLANYLLGRHTRATDGCVAALPLLEKSVRIRNAGTVAFIPDYAACLLESARIEDAREAINQGRGMARKYRNQSALRALEQVAAQIPAPVVEQ